VIEGDVVERFKAPVLKTEFFPMQNFILWETSIQSRTTTKGSASKSGNNLATEMM
jgi:hypothetical protein